MKLSALHQSYLNRRANTFRGGSAPSESSPEFSAKSPATVFWFVVHGLCCLISLVLGFRFSRLVFFFLFSTSSMNLYAVQFRSASELIGALDIPAVSNRDVQLVNRTSSSRVVVGRHGIRIRPWPHPDPTETMKAHRIIETVQNEQRRQFGAGSPRKIIAVTPTYVRTFQALHLTGVMHSLMLVPHGVVWIVVEAGGVTNETASIVSKSGLDVVHIGFHQRMPNTWDGRHRIEARMRLRALRVMRERKFDGIVMFADDSNMHSMELFDEIQNVKWFGAVSVGILAHSDNADVSSEMQKTEEGNPMMPIQGPACNSSDKLVGWYTFNSLPYVGKSAKYIDDRAPVLPRSLEWAGFVLNSRLLWGEAEDKPEGVNDLDTIAGADEIIGSPLFLLKDASIVEPLGSCGRQVLLWWLRVEARYDSKFPTRWTINPPLEITVPSKRTPWPDTPPELPNGNVEVNGVEQHTGKHTTKIQAPRSKRSSRSKRKHETKTIEMQTSARNT